MPKCLLVVSDLHCGSIYGLLPPGFTTSDGRVVSPNAGQAYLWSCWSTLAEYVGKLKIAGVIVNGDVVDGRQQAQRGTELCLPMIEDQAAAAEACLKFLRKHTGPARWYFTQGCLTPGHPVLRADLTWSDVGSLSTGDKIIGFNDGPVGTGRGRGFIETEVTATSQPMRQTVEVELADGTTLTCTADHPVWCGRWVRAKHLRPGWRIPRLVPHWRSATEYEVGWVAGVFDGEATLSFRPYGGRRSLRLEVAQNRGVVLDGITGILARHGFEYSLYKNGRDRCVTVHLKGGGAEVLRFLGVFRPKRMLQKLSSLLSSGSALAFDGADDV